MLLVNYSFFKEIYSVLGCWDFVTFSHIEEPRPSSSWHSSDSSKSNKEKDKDEGNLDKQFEHLDIFEQKQRTDKSMNGCRKVRQKCQRATEGTWPFSMTAWKPFWAKDKLKGVLEVIEKKQTQQLQLIDQFMNISCI